MPEITYDEFSKVELKIATILSAERISGSDKLLKLSIQVGSETRTLAAGIALQYAPESLVGKQIVIVANLAPRTLRGVTSQGMLLAAEGEGGSPVLLMPERQVQSGSNVK